MSASMSSTHAAFIACESAHREEDHDDAGRHVPQGHPLDPNGPPQGHALRVR